MTGFDYAVAGIMLLSLLVGVWRGLVYEVLSLLGWPIAFVLSRMYAASIAPIMPGAQEAVRIALAYAVMFIAALIVWGILVWGFSRLVKAVGLGWLDGFLGSIFGLLRGVLVVLVLVWLAGLTTMPEQAYWRNAYSSKVIEDFALLGKVWLPESLSQRIHYGNRS
ncbi:MAG: CvpA family protein [Gallionella sp.]|nr:CvpA family protein [Gallionella sp.]